MLFRPDGDAVLAFSQPAHAWVSGQLARAWGNEEVGSFEPREEVCLAAEQHDIGWVTWETRPTLNPKTGRPRTFREMPTATHIELWSQALPFALTLGRYTALLVSLHGTGLYERFGPAPDAPAETLETVRAFVERERAAQQRLIDSLSGDPRYARYVDSATLQRNRRLISAWDYMSLVLCGGIDEAVTIPGVPGRVEPFDLTLAPSSGEASAVRVDPWPFAADSVQVIVDARRLTGRFDDESAMRDALDAAEWVSLRIDLMQSGRQ
jgi:hypothetical protein